MGNRLTQIEWLLKIILIDDDYRMQEDVLGRSIWKTLESPNLKPTLDWISNSYSLIQYKYQLFLNLLTHK